MSEEQLPSWQDVIKQYIDGLNDGAKLKQYVDELLSLLYFNHLLSATTAQKEEQKALSKEITKVEKTPTSAKNRVKFETFYQAFHSKGWVSDLSEKIKFISGKTDFYNVWVCRSVVIGDGAVPGTHIAKLTHSSSAGSSFLDRTTDRKNAYLSTNTLGNKTLDGTYPNATLSKQVKFLMLEHNGVTLFDEVINGNDLVFSGFESRPEELTQWSDQYRKILTKKPSTDFLLKQVYFPIDEGYHLLTVVRSSSLSQKIYESQFSKDARKLSDPVNKARKAGKYSAGISKQAIGVAKISTTLSQPQNVSVLNGKRGGRVRLFSAQPPVWQNQKKPPLYKRSWFYENGIFRATKDDIDYLRDFLLRFGRLELSTKHPKKEKWMIDWVKRIISDVLFFAESTQNLPAGWSNHPDIKLKVEQQYFLDPYRSDEAFQAAKKATDWQPVVCADFASWLNDRLKGKDKKFTPKTEHSKLWKSLMAQALRESSQVVDVVLAHQKEEEQ